MHRITGTGWEAVPEQQGADTTADFCQHCLVAIVLGLLARRWLLLVGDPGLAWAEANAQAQLRG